MLTAGNFLKRNDSARCQHTLFTNRIIPQDEFTRFHAAEKFRSMTEHYFCLRNFKICLKITNLVCSVYFLCSPTTRNFSKPYIITEKQTQASPLSFVMLRTSIFPPWSFAIACAIERPIALLTQITMEVLPKIVYSVFNTN